MTGGIASGKSTLCGIFGEMGYSVGSADVVSREVFGRAMVQEFLRGELGEGDLRELARGRMGDAGFRGRLNRVVHPLIFDELLGLEVDVLEIPLLVESGLVSQFGVVVGCDCSREVVLDRLEARLGDRVLGEKLVASQVGVGVRLVFCDAVVRTDDGLDSVRKMAQLLADRFL